MTKSERLIQELLSDIAGGKHPAGSHLPTHREFAKLHGVSLAVVNKVYEELRRRDLIATGRRRGTIVKSTVVPESHAEANTPIDEEGSRVCDLTHNYPMIEAVEEEMAAALATAIRSRRKLEAPREHVLRETGDKWFDDIGIERGGRTVHPAVGGQHALVAVLMLLRLRTGDTIYADQYTYSGLRLAASSLDMTIVPIELDAEGMLAKALTSAIRKHGPGAIYLMPSLHNPMSFAMSPQRILEIAKLAKSFDCPVIEDETYRYLVKSPAPSIATAYPEGTFSITTLSKIYGPQVQLGFIASPVSFDSEISASLRSCIWAVNSPIAALASEWVRSGQVWRHIEAIRDATARFRTLIESLFPREAISPSADAFFVWLKLPAHWANGGFVEYARRGGVLVLSDQQFALGPNLNQYVRFSGFAAQADVNLIARAVRTLATTYASDQARLISTA